MIDDRRTMLERSVDPGLPGIDERRTGKRVYEKWIKKIINAGTEKGITCLPEDI
jgi:hypothetical protein